MKWPVQTRRALRRCREHTALFDLSSTSAVAHVTIFSNVSSTQLGARIIFRRSRLRGQTSSSLLGAVFAPLDPGSGRKNAVPSHFTLPEAHISDWGGELGAVFAAKQRVTTVYVWNSSPKTERNTVSR